jgi:hypothetical protein
MIAFGRLSFRLDNIFRGKSRRSSASAAKPASRAIWSAPLSVVLAAAVGWGSFPDAAFMRGPIVTEAQEPFRTENSAAERAPARDRVLLVVSVPGLSFLELTDTALEQMPHLRRLIRRAAIGAMNVRTPERGIEDSYLTLGAGAPAIIRKGIPPLERDETWLGESAPILYRRLNESAAADAADSSFSPRIVFPAIGSVRHQNEQAHYGAVPGLLGEMLSQNGVNRYVFGSSAHSPAVPSELAAYVNADADWTADHRPDVEWMAGNPPDAGRPDSDAVADSLMERREGDAEGDAADSSAAERADAGLPGAVSGDEDGRFAPLLLMDFAGTVPYGLMGGQLQRRDAGMPHGLATDFDRLWRQVRQVKRPAAVIMEIGDLHRLYEEQALYDPEAFRIAKRKVLAEMDAFLGKLYAGLGADDALWLFSPMPNKDALKQNRLLAPWVIMESGASAQRILMSPSTRQPGIVSNLDFAPTMLDFFDVEPPPSMTGEPVKASVRPDGFARLMDDLEHIRNVYTVRPRLLYPYVSYEIAVLLLGLLAALTGWRRAARWLRLPLLSLLVGPAVMLLLGYLSWWKEPAVVAGFVAGTAVLTWAAGRMGGLRPLLAIAALNAGLILLDGLAFDAAGMKRSVLGYDPNYGARYYGIGNEYMGVLVGSVVLFVSIFLHHWSKKADAARKERAVSMAVGAGLAAVTFYLALPMFGTNAGGAISAAVAFGFGWMRWFTGTCGQPIPWRKLSAVVAGFGALALAVLWISNMAIPAAAGQESHIGKAMRRLFSGDIEAIGLIVIRKLEMNFHLINVSVWSRLLATSLAVIAVLVLRPLGLFRRWQERFPLIMHGFSANAVGAITALLVNDSGIVSAATIIICVAAPMLLFIFDSRQSDMHASHSS